MNALDFAVYEKGVVVTGKTFDVKDILKAHGAAWDSQMAAWVFRGQGDVEAVRATVAAEVDAALAAKSAAKKAVKAHRAWLKTPAGQAHAVAEARAAGAYWICCDKCKVIDWERQHTSCTVCVRSFRVRGVVYTGD